MSKFEFSCKEISLISTQLVNKLTATHIEIWPQIPLNLTTNSPEFDRLSPSGCLQTWIPPFTTPRSDHTGNSAETGRTTAPPSWTNLSSSSREQGQNSDPSASYLLVFRRSIDFTSHVNSIIVLWRVIYFLFSGTVVVTRVINDNVDLSCSQNLFRHNDHLFRYRIKFPQVSRHFHKRRVILKTRNPRS